MQHRVACISEEEINNMAQNSNNVIMKSYHDNVYKPWDVARVKACVDDITGLTRCGISPEKMKKDSIEIFEFSTKYKTFFSKLTDILFVNDEEHMEVLKKIISIKSLVDQGLIDETEGQKRCVDASLSKLIHRAKGKL